MIKTYTLHTFDADDAGNATDEILAQLKKVQLLKNSVGILICHYDYVNNGIVAALQNRLPFEVVGITTFYQATEAADGLFALTITLLTSDTVKFSTGYSERSNETPVRRIKSVYESASANGKPDLLLNFLSISRPVSGDEYLRLADEVSGGVPCFGAVTTGDSDSVENMYLFCGGHIFSEGFAMLAMTGDVSAKFYYASYLENQLLTMTATVTKASGTAVKELNGQKAVDFVKKLGLSLDANEMGSLSTIPYLVRMPGDDTLVSRTLQSFTADGALEFMAEVPEGSMMRIGTVSTDDILQVSEGITKKAISENADAALLLMFSCVGRYIALGLESTAEMERMRAAVPKGITFMSCYAAGEICPIEGKGKMLNRYHNSSFIICAIR